MSTRRIEHHSNPASNKPQAKLRKLSLSTLALVLGAGCGLTMEEQAALEQHGDEAFVNEEIAVESVTQALSNWEADEGDRVCLTTKNKKHAGTNSTIKVMVTSEKADQFGCNINGIGRNATACCTLRYVNNRDWRGGEENFLNLQSCNFNEDHNNVYLRLNSKDNAYITKIQLHHDESGGGTDVADDFYCHGGMGSCQDYQANTYYKWFKLGKGRNKEKRVRVAITGSKKGDAYGEGPDNCLGSGWSWNF